MLPTPLKACTYSGDAYRFKTSDFKTLPNLGTLVICCASTYFLGENIAASLVLNNQPFFIPDLAMASNALLFADADINSDIVVATEVFKFFSSPNNCLIAIGNSSPVFKNLYFLFFNNSVPIFFN